MAAMWVYLTKGYFTKIQFHKSTVHKSTVDEATVGWDTFTTDIVDGGKFYKDTALCDNEGDTIGVYDADIERFMLVKTLGETIDLYLVLKQEKLIVLW